MARLGRMSTLGWVWSLVFIAAGCGPLPRDNAVPFELQDRAMLPGLGPEARTWGAEMNPAFLETMRRSVQWEQEALGTAGRAGPMPRADFLAISGGGANGAFGAGLLCGWSEKGDRPTFKVVTGISTGALIAPFAFVGPKYDHVLRQVYTKTKTEELLHERGLLAGLFSDAMADTKPMWQTLSKYVDQKLVDEIAAEYH